MSQIGFRAPGRAPGLASDCSWTRAAERAGAARGVEGAAYSNAAVEGTLANPRFTEIDRKMVETALRLPLNGGLQRSDKADGFAFYGCMVCQPEVCLQAHSGAGVPGEATLAVLVVGSAV